jgi:hypothetical protein
MVIAVAEKDKKIVIALVLLDKADERGRCRAFFFEPGQLVFLRVFIVEDMVLDAPKLFRVARTIFI